MDPTHPPLPPDLDAQKNCAPQSAQTPAGDPQKNSAAQGGPVAESALAAVLGVNRDVLRTNRGEKGLHWTGGDGSAVLITAAGQARLQELLQAGPNNPLIPAAVESVHAAPAAYVTMVVLRVLPRMLLAKRQDDLQAPAVRILVQGKTDNFLPNMLVPKCQQSRVHPGTYYFHGRVPRYRGKF